MTRLEDIQRHVGVDPDGRLGPQTLDAIAAALGMVDGGLHQLSKPSLFFADLRSNLTGPLDQVQVDSINRILAAGNHLSLDHMAYVLATAWHEARFKPVAEAGKGKGKPYGKPGKYGQAQYGRGLVQLTWDFNYEWADKRLGLDGALLKDFDLALDPEIAARILVIGMTEGAFTGKKMADYLSWVDMRRVVNGTDKADLIAGYAKKIHLSLLIGGWQ